MQTSKILISRPSTGVSPSGFTRLTVEMLPREVIRLVGYDPRVLIMKPKRGKTARGSRDIMPHNVSQSIIDLQNQVQRSVDNTRVTQMVDYLANAMKKRAFADWGAIELATSHAPDLSDMETKHVAALDSDADYFITDGQHRYCALMDFAHEYPEFADKFTQSVTISILPEEKLIQWAGQEFHDRNYFSVPVRAGKALSVDTRDPVNALAKELSEHPVIKAAGGIAYDRDQLLKDDPRFTTHSLLHRFVRGFLFGRPGLDKGVDTRSDISSQAQANLNEFVAALGEILPWKAPLPERDTYLTRTSVLLSSLAVIGNDLYNAEPPIALQDKVSKLLNLARMDWRRTNLGLVGVIGSEKDGQVAPASSRQAIDSTIRFLREKLDLSKSN